MKVVPNFRQPPAIPVLKLPWFSHHHQATPQVQSRSQRKKTKMQKETQQEP